MAIKMSRNEFYAKYGDVQLAFIQYYKYIFTYMGKLPDGQWLSVNCRGDAEDIYRHDCSIDDVETIHSLQPYAAVVYKNGQKIKYFSDHENIGKYLLTSA